MNKDKFYIVKRCEGASPYWFWRVTKGQDGSIMAIAHADSDVRRKGVKSVYTSNKLKDSTLFEQISMQKLIGLFPWAKYHI